MDSLTQIALGAALGQAVLGRQLGRPALLWGAALGTFPDLDILLPLGDAVESFTRHRSFSHSLLVLGLLSPLFAWLGTRLHPQTRSPDQRGLSRRWLSMVLLVFYTHVLLDCCTVYGTQIFWPLAWTPESWSTVFVIDPLYTLPLLVGCGAAALRRPGLNRWGLWLSSLYLLWSFAAKWQVETRVAQALARQGIPAGKVLTTPTAFNTLLWRVVVVSKQRYSEGYLSLLDPADQLELRHYPNQAALLEPLASHPPVQRLRWFTAGLLSTRLQDGEVLLTDLRMGAEPNYLYRFAVARQQGPALRPHPPVRRRDPLEFGALGRVWRRIFDPRVRLGPD